MQIGSGAHAYEWIEDWAKIPDSAGARHGWAHPGMACSTDGRILTFHHGDPTALVFDRDGHLLRTIDTQLAEGHGIALTREGDAEYLWIADTGAKRRPEYGYGYAPGAGKVSGQVVKMTMDGRVVLRVGEPDLPIYREGKYSPTSVAVYEERWGGNGDIWVADGYGQDRVYRYSRFTKNGEYVDSIGGSEGGAGGFRCPHGIWIDLRKPDPELYIADRTNRRIQVYDLEGKWKRAFGPDFLISPSAFARQGDCLIVAELHARLTVLDPEDRLVCYLGRNEEVAALDGWPNMIGSDGVPTRTSRLEPGKFNSPHGIATDESDNVYVAEWLIGGRTIKLIRVRA